jgi:ankyrin repeat protein
MKKHANAVFVVDKRDSNGTTLLMESARQGTYERLLQCLVEGSDINAVDLAGNNALLYAIEGGQPEMAAILLNHGIDAERKNSSGNTPLIAACIGRAPEVVQRLLQKNVALDVQNKRGNTALIMACAAGDGWAACKLVDAGANIDLLNEQGASAMMLARRVMIPKDFTLFEACVEKRREKQRQDAAIAADKKQRELEQNVRDATVLQNNVVPLKPVAFRRKGF